MLVKHAESYRKEAIPQALLDAMGEFVGEGFKSGILKDTAGLKETAEGFRVRSSKNRLTVTDGPFTEAKEVVGGYALVEVASREEAMKTARQFMELHRAHWPASRGSARFVANRHSAGSAPFGQRPPRNSSIAGKTASGRSAYAALTASGMTRSLPLGIALAHDRFMARPSVSRSP
jgi:hypothetical protein